MPRPYRARNKRIIQRGSGGRFRRSTLSDVGMGECETCGAIHRPDFSDLPRPVDPRVMRDRTKQCADCLKKKKEQS